MKFKQFLEEQTIQQALDEAIRPKETKFGSNFPQLIDEQWKSVTYLGNQLTSTAFDGDDRWVVVDLTSSNDLIFRTYPKFSDIESFEDLASRARFDKSRAFRGNAAAISIIKKVLYVGLIKLKHVKEFSFSTMNPSLINLYARMVDSKPFQEEMAKLNFHTTDIKHTSTNFEVTYRKV